ncbi:IS1 ORF1 [Escherichia coli O104:H4 str. LB226692]|nr:IS1 ORF1 [Escherichia coli O104:H4 str. LB226692]
MYDGVFEVLQWLLFLSAIPPVQLLTGWCVTAKAPPDISAISALTAVKHGNCSSLTPLLNPVRTRKSLIWPMNGVGCRATARIMGVGLNTILRHLKNSGRSR